jgi:hypothetical protein
MIPPLGNTLETIDLQARRFQAVASIFRGSRLGHRLEATARRLRVDQGTDSHGGQANTYLQKTPIFHCGLRADAEVDNFSRVLSE